MLNNKKNLQDISERYGQFTEGVHRDLAIKSIELTSGSSPRISIRIATDKGDIKQAIYKSIFLPDKSRVTPKAGESEQAAIERVENNFAGDCSSFLIGCGLTIAESTIEGKDVVDFANKMIKIVQGLVIGKKRVDLLVIHSEDKQWPEVPKYNYIAPFDPSKPSILVAPKVEEPKQKSVDPFLSELNGLQPTVVEEQDLPF